MVYLDEVVTSLYVLHWVVALCIAEEGQKGDKK
jgi:hypothetical protein